MATSSTSATPLVYSCISHNTTILAECSTSASSKASSLARRVLSTIDRSSHQEKTYTQDEDQISYISESPSEHYDNPSAGGLTFLVVAHGTPDTRMSFLFLREVRDRFFRELDSNEDFASMLNYGTSFFNSQLRDLMVEYGTTNSDRNDPLQNAKLGLQDAKDTMHDTVETLLNRNSKLDRLSEQTANLNSSSQAFRIRSRDLRRQMWWKNVKLMATIGVVVFVIILIIIIALTAGK
ncbi:synaptobrevin [Metarhizium rileyi]|uniref:Synaptobrevin homolog YKT6 n=1 Tax=Metarhizium rileyi (strain RCEF 4871) TaxID=1649241 RepID=A0A166XLE8_METRR|nr:synaptobrevin [Metarhizium rileyi RCEF 4871]